MIKLSSYVGRVETNTLATGKNKALLMHTRINPGEAVTSYLVVINGETRCNTYTLKVAVNEYNSEY